MGVVSSGQHFSLQPLVVLGGSTCGAYVSEIPGLLPVVTAPAGFVTTGRSLALLIWGRQCFGFMFIIFKGWPFCHGDSGKNFKRHQNSPFVLVMAVWNLTGNCNIFKNGLLCVPWNRHLQGFFKHKWIIKEVPMWIIYMLRCRQL